MIKRGLRRGGCALQETHTRVHSDRKREKEVERRLLGIENPLLFIYFKLTSGTFAI